MSMLASRDKQKGEKIIYSLVSLLQENTERPQTPFKTTVSITQGLYLIPETPYLCSFL